MSEKLIENCDKKIKIIKIIKADASHYQEISFLGRETFAETFRYLFKPDTLERFLEYTYNPEKIKKSLIEEGNHFLLAYFNNEPVGYAKIIENSFYDGISDSNQIQIEKFYILSDFHRLGVGSLIMEEGLELFKKLSPITVWLAVLETNYKAINYYKKSGFEKSGKYYYNFEDLNFTFDVMYLKV